MKNIKRTNKYGASIVYCSEHMPKHIHNILGKPILQTKTNEPCPDCQAYQKWLDMPDIMFQALISPKCAHTRQRGDSVYCYHRDPLSPSGVLKAAILDVERFDAVYNKALNAGLITSSKSPLSPTEGVFSTSYCP